MTRLEGILFGWPETEKLLDIQLKSISIFGGRFREKKSSSAFFIVLKMASMLFLNKAATSACATCFCLAEKLTAMKTITAPTTRTSIHFRDSSIIALLPTPLFFINLYNKSFLLNILLCFSSIVLSCNCFTIRPIKINQ